MSEIEKQMPEQEYLKTCLPNATYITNEALEEFPNVKHFFELLVKDTVIDIKSVGEPFQYEYDIIKNRYYADHGQFMYYFIRKHLSNQFNIDIIDRRIDHILETPEDYIIGTNTNLHNAIKRHYEIFKDPRTKAMDIIKSIKIVSLSFTIYFRRALPKSEYAINEDNLREVIKYFESLPYNSVALNPALDCEYFNADANLLFDNEIMYQLKTSKYKSLCNDEPEIPLSKFYQPIIYGFGFYKNTGKKIKKFKIYNPLLSYEYSIELNNIDFVLFEKVLKRDVEVFSRCRKFLDENMFLDLTLFGEEEKD